MRTGSDKEPEGRDKGIGSFLHPHPGARKGELEALPVTE
ncbi:hypothetical protein LptCag_2049 [Leptospirillum ferriphilum]|uniref:Uncharacterized protein n=1 Tax=Leptospirillum ferriphilum TaxID=178606 RepID=A0A094X7X7_9BACT|nr:hypothetical protein LptCag_2049 [Leptospirillum ferriphilum]